MKRSDKFVRKLQMLPEFQLHAQRWKSVTLTVAPVSHFQLAGITDKRRIRLLSMSPAKNHNMSAINNNATDEGSGSPMECKWFNKEMRKN